MMNTSGPAGLPRRRFLGTAMAGGVGAWGLTSLGGPGTARAARSLEDPVAELRSKFFTGPVTERIDLDTLDPARRPDSSQLGTIGHFQFVDRYPWMTPDNLLPFAVAAGIKWVRTGFRHEDWDWSAGKPGAMLKSWVDADLKAGIKPLFTTSNRNHLGTHKEVSGWVDMVRAAIGEWGEDVGAFMLDNEPNNSSEWKTHYGGEYWGGPWLDAYTRFAEQCCEQVKTEFPNVFLVNGIQVESQAMGQIKRSAPRIDALCMHHYTYKHGLPPEYTPRTGDAKFRDFATSDVEFEQAMSDYLRQGRMLLGRPDLQVWMTEIGLPTLSQREFPPDTLEPMSETQQAKTIARMLVLGLLTATKTFLYTLADQGHNAARDGDTFGVVTDDLRPKQGFFVLGRISALTGGRATPDPEFLAIATRLDGTLPGYVKQVNANTLVKEELRAERLVTADGRALVAVWSTAPPRDNFAPRRATFAVNKTLGKRPVLVDPMTGRSRFLVTRPGPGGAERFDLDVRDYPQFILAEK
ncbi:hypothetical protein OHA25_52775 [Nonomuraea sp. NBC_00507]|uniref:hypothetical protein n=1 Tax=Nonomuraea sp. NBC_00507 TaxID=2976002 RepID=UPI002E172247